MGIFFYLAFYYYVAINKSFERNKRAVLEAHNTSWLAFVRFEFFWKWINKKKTPVRKSLFSYDTSELQNYDTHLLKVFSAIQNFPQWDNGNSSRCTWNSDSKLMANIYTVLPYTTPSDIKIAAIFVLQKEIKITVFQPILSRFEISLFSFKHISQILPSPVLPLKLSS